MSKISATVISLIPNAHGGVGHHVGYHLSVGEAARLCGWRHVALVERDHGLASLAPGWRACLPINTVNDGLITAIRRLELRRLVSDIASLRDAVAAEVKSELAQTPGICVVLLDDFNGPQLLAVCQAINSLRASPQLRFWLLYRSAPEAGFVARAYHAVVKRLLGRMPPAAMQLLTDSEPLAQAVEAAFGRPVRVMPIPHTTSTSPINAERGTEILCWWPGAPRPEKGLSAIRALVRASPDHGKASSESPPVRLILSEAAGIGAQTGPIAVLPLPQALSADAYQQWLHGVDVILLPYEGPRYQYSTSGIFAECIVAGRIPLTRAGTWMAFELAQFGLESLICDWKSPQEVIARIRSVVVDGAVRRKLAGMREHYVAFHNETSYAAAMKSLLDSAGAPRASQ